MAFLMFIHNLNGQISFSVHDKYSGKMSSIIIYNQSDTILNCHDCDFKNLDTSLLRKYENFYMECTFGKDTFSNEILSFDLFLMTFREIFVETYTYCPELYSPCGTSDIDIKKFYFFSCDGCNAYFMVIRKNDSVTPPAIEEIDR